NCDCVRRTQSCSGTGRTPCTREPSKKSCSASKLAASRAAASSGNSAITRERCQPSLGGGMPGSPNKACSASVMASASSTDTLNASSASKASPTTSMAASGTTITSSKGGPPAAAAVSALTLGQPLFEVVDVGAAGHELRVHHQFAVQGDVGLDALDHRFGQRRAHARQRLLAGVAVHDELADHGV